MRIFQIAWGGVEKARLWKLVAEQRLLLEKQQALIDDLQAELDAYELKSVRGIRDLVRVFHDHLEQGTPEETLRDGIEAGLTDLNDHVARLEEHSAS